MRQSDVARFGGSQCALRQRAWVGGTQCCAIPRSSREACGWRTVGAEGDGATPNSDLVVELARRACSINHPKVRDAASPPFIGVSRCDARNYSLALQISRFARVVLVRDVVGHKACH